MTVDALALWRRLHDEYLVARAEAALAAAAGDTDGAARLDAEALDLDRRRAMAQMSDDYSGCGRWTGD